MKPSKKFLSYLEKNGIPSTCLEHKTTYTAYDTAVTLRVPLFSVVKTLCVKSEKGFLCILLPASHRLDMIKLAQCLKVKKITLPSEKDLTRFLKINPTKSPLVPCGDLYGIPTVYDLSLLKSRTVYVGSGSFSHALSLASKELKRIPHGIGCSFSFLQKKKVLKNKITKKKIRI